MMPITMTRIGCESTIKKINGNDEAKNFLRSLGFIEGEKVTVLNEIGGNVIVNVKDSRIALNKSMANRIIV